MGSLQAVLREGGVNIELDYGQGSDLNSRFKQASTAVEEFKKNTDAAKKQFDVLRDVYKRQGLRKPFGTGTLFPLPLPPP